MSERSERKKFERLSNFLLKYKKELIPEGYFSQTKKNDIYALAVDIYGVANGLRPAMGDNFFSMSEIFIKNKNFLKEDFPDLVIIDKLPTYIYNKELISAKEMKPRKNEDPNEFLGRIYGYPEPFDDTNIEHIVNNKYPVTKQYYIYIKGKKFPTSVLGYDGSEMTIEADILQKIMEIYKPLSNELKVYIYKSVPNFNVPRETITTIEEFNEGYEDEEIVEEYEFRFSMNPIELS